jgi:phosphoribosylformylglycinamidine cyclo-ligase
VNVAAGDRAVELMRAAIESTRRPEVVGGVGGFGAAVALPSGYREPILVSSTDGVGTKTAIAVAQRRFDTIGRDLVAMCADDVVCSGASPLFFLDYIAVGRLDPAGVAELVGGIAAGCLEAGCALVGGETAEHPGLMDPEDFDMAGCCIGVVERDRIIDGSRIRAGDAIVGLASSGLHANGFSLVRTLIEKWQLDLARPYQEQLLLSLGDAIAEPAIKAEPAHLLATLGEVLLTPSTIYASLILGLRTALEAAGSDLRGVAHITGGGLHGNVPRMLPPDLAARLDPSRWPVPSIIRLAAALGGLDDEEARATFNAGIGMVLTVPADAVPIAIAGMKAAGVDAWLVGEVVPITVAGARYVEGRLEAVG